MEKDKYIKKEITRLKRILKDLDKNKFDLVLPLIKRAAAMSVYLDELEETINNDGYTQEYQNGIHQRGITQSADVQTYLAMSKIYQSITKQLYDLVPVALKTQKKGLLVELRKGSVAKTKNGS